MRRDDQILALCKHLRMDGVVRFRDKLHRFKCLYLVDREVLKLFQPQSVRRIGGRSTDRVLSGNIGLVLRRDVNNIGIKNWLDMPTLISLAPIANFPNLIRVSGLSETGEVDPDFVDELHALLHDLPATLVEIGQRFGQDFLSLSPLDRLSIMVGEMRSMGDRA